MTKCTYFLISSTIVIVLNCGGGKGAAGLVWEDVSLDSFEEGMIGNDTIAVTGDGVSSEGAKLPLQKEASAKRSARFDAQRKVI